jgi:cellulose biosynthesis protein BcsQ
MRNTIAKGGVGKSTLVLALAETLSAYHDKDVLVIDADAQASVSHVLTRQTELAGHRCPAPRAIIMQASSKACRMTFRVLAS